MKNRSEWLLSLKAGDEVIVEEGVFSRKISLCKVVRTTPHQIVVERASGREAKYRKKDGDEVGKYTPSLYESSSLSQPTDEIREKLKKERLVNEIAYKRADFWGTLSTGALLEIKEIMSKDLVDAETESQG